MKPLHTDGVFSSGLPNSGARVVQTLAPRSAFSVATAPERAP